MRSVRPNGASRLRRCTRRRSTVLRCPPSTSRRTASERVQQCAPPPPISSASSPREASHAVRWPMSVCFFVPLFVCLFELQSTVVDDDAIGRVTITCRVLEPGAAGYAPCRSFGSGLVRPRAASDCRLRLVAAPGKHAALRACCCAGYGEQCAPPHCAQWCAPNTQTFHCAPPAICADSLFRVSVKLLQRSALSCNLVATQHHCLFTVARWAAALA